jgi:hypothetical protein
MIFRATRGKALTYFQDLSELHTKKYVGTERILTRTVYIIVFQDGLHARGKLTKLCDSFLGESFEIPSSSDQTELLRKVTDI